MENEFQTFRGFGFYSTRLGTDTGRRLPVGGAWVGPFGEGDMGGSTAFWAKSQQGHTAGPSVLG